MWALGVGRSDGGGRGGCADGVGRGEQALWTLLVHVQADRGALGPARPAGAASGFGPRRVGVHQPGATGAQPAVQQPDLLGGRAAQRPRPGSTVWAAARKASTTGIGGLRAASPAAASRP